MTASRSPAADNPIFDRGWRLSVALRDADADREIARETVSATDLLDAEGEVWFDGFVRTGRPDIAFEALSFDVAPSFADGAGGSCDGFLVRGRPHDGAGAAALHFPAAALAHTADRAATRLVAEGRLNLGDLYTYTVVGVAAAEKGKGAEQDKGKGMLDITVRSRPLELAAVDIEGLLADAEVVGATGDDDVPVVFRRAALDKAKRYARKGEADHPPVETGCMLVGRLAADAVSRTGVARPIVLVEDAIELRAVGAEFSLVYTADTWSSIHRALSAGPRNGRHLVGQAHGHNFRLEGEPCEACHERDRCTRTTVFTSTEDRRFMRTVFARQPWALCWIAGSNARRERTSALFTFHRGVLRERGYHVTDQNTDPDTTS